MTKLVWCNATSDFRSPTTRACQYSPALRAIWTSGRPLFGFPRSNWFHVFLSKGCVLLHCHHFCFLRICIIITALMDLRKKEVGHPPCGFSPYKSWIILIYHYLYLTNAFAHPIGGFLCFPFLYLICMHCTRYYIGHKISDRTGARIFSHSKYYCKYYICRTERTCSFPGEVMLCRTKTFIFSIIFLVL